MIFLLRHTLTLILRDVDDGPTLTRYLTLSFDFQQNIVRLILFPYSVLRDFFLIRIFLIQGVPASDDEDEVDNKTYIKEAEQKLKKQQDELNKIDTGIAKVFLQDREKDRENLRHKAANVDPRNASRTPSAAREPTYRLRYESPVGACKLCA